MHRGKRMWRRRMPTDRTSKRFVLAVADYISGTLNPARRITITQAASMAGCSQHIMRTHLKRIKAPMYGRGPRITRMEPYKAETPDP